MHVLVFNGSPSGQDSVTLRFVRYLEKKHPEHTFFVEAVATKIHTLETNMEAWDELMEQVDATDLILWAFPVYVYLVPAPLKRFIELLFAREPQRMKGKYTAAISTSIHFYDTTAHDYLREIAEDLGMGYLGAWSGTAGDLLEESQRAQFLCQAGRFLRDAEAHVLTQSVTVPQRLNSFAYVPKSEPEPLDTKGKRILLLTDQKPGDNLSFMTARIQKTFPDMEVIHLWQSKILGGCLGCFQCTFDHQCVYGDRDDIKAIYNEKIAKADIVLYGANIVDRYLSARWKLFIDRRFMNNHTPFLAGKQLGVVLSGAYSGCNTLKRFLRAEAEINDGSLAGIVTDENVTSEELDKLLDQFCRDIVTKAVVGEQNPPSFDGIGGKKLFRDGMFGAMRFVFRADHAYYKAHGWYDFPQNDRKMMMKTRIAIALTNSPKVRGIIKKQMRKRMLEPYDRLLSEETKD